jgi:histone arginine demethylase JMJD6
MSAFTSVEKKDTISYEEFVENHLKPKIPVVFKNASSAWKNNKIFSPAFFRENFGDYKTFSEGKEYCISEILDITAKSTAENPAPYPIIFEIPEQIPELLPYIDPIHMNFAKPNWFRSGILPYGKFGNHFQLFIGGKGNQYTLHKDFYHTNAWITQLYGQKKFVMFPSNQDEFLYNGPKPYADFLSPINIVNPDHEKYPKYKQATPIEVLLEPGETIFVPNGVWHTTVAPGQNISLIYDQLNEHNVKNWLNDIYEYKKDEGIVKASAHYALAATLVTAARAVNFFRK